MDCNSPSNGRYEPVLFTRFTWVLDTPSPATEADLGRLWTVSLSLLTQASPVLGEALCSFVWICRPVDTLAISREDRPRGEGKQAVLHVNHFARKFWDHRCQKFGLQLSEMVAWLPAPICSLSLREAYSRYQRKIDPRQGSWCQTRVGPIPGLEQALRLWTVLWNWELEAWV